MHNRAARTTRMRVRPIVAALAAAACLVAYLTAADASRGANHPARANAVEVTFWWWGNDEAPGLRNWIKETARLFEAKNPGITIKAVEQTTDGLVQSAQAAQAAQKGPDIQYYWPVGWMQTDMFNGGLEPLDKWLPNEVQHYLPAYRNYASWNGHVYAAPFYAVGNPWVYRKDLFRKAGLDPNNPPRTFEQFLAAGRKLKAAGIIPIAAGMKDQFYADWPWMLWQACGLDTPAQWFDGFLSTSGQGLAAPAFTQTWKKIQTTIAAGMYPPNVRSIGLYDGFNLLLQGKAAMASPVAPTTTSWARKLGSDKLGVMLTPCQGEGKLGQSFPDAAQYVAMPTFAKHKKEAAQFIAFMHTPGRMLALLRQAGALSGDDRLPLARVSDPVTRQMLQWGRTNSYFALYYTAPPTVDTWIWPNVGKLFAGGFTPAQAGQAAQSANQKWLKRNGQLARDFGRWKASLARGG